MVEVTCINRILVRHIPQGTLNKPHYHHRLRFPTGCKHLYRGKDRVCSHSEYPPMSFHKNLLRTFRNSLLPCYVDKCSVLKKEVVDFKIYMYIKALSARYVRTSILLATLSVSITIARNTSGKRSSVGRVMPVFMCAALAELADISLRTLAHFNPVCSLTRGSSPRSFQFHVIQKSVTLRDVSSSDLDSC